MRTYLVCFPTSSCFFNFKNFMVSLKVAMTSGTNITNVKEATI